MSNTNLIHIFDAIARDQRVLRATEDEVEVEYVSDDLGSDSEGEYIKKRKNKNKSLDNRALIIHLFGNTAEGTPCRVEVNGFRPYFFVALPPCRTPTEEQKAKTTLDSFIRTKFSKQKDDIETELVYKQKLYGYTGGKKFGFLKISVPSMGMFYEMKKIFLDDRQMPKCKLTGYSEILKVYEANIDPMLRFFHTQNLQPCGWCKINNAEELESDDNAIKLKAEWTDIHPAESKVVSAPFLHGFWDIECYSHDGEFPLAKQGYRRVAKQLWQQATMPEEVPLLLEEAFLTSNSTIKLPPLKTGKPRSQDVSSTVNTESFKKTISNLWSVRSTSTGKEKEERISELTTLLDNTLGRLAKIAGDPIIQIGTVLWRPGQAVGTRHIFVLGGCAPIEGVVIHSYKTEKDVILHWFQWVLEENIDVFVGYNIFGFDERYMWERLCELGLEQEDSVQQLSRLFDEGGTVKLEEKRLASSALGDNMLYMWTTPGRLRIDLYGHVKRKAKMNSYKLDSVAAAFLSGKLSGVLPCEENGKWLLKTKQKGDARIGRYVQVLDDLGEELTEKMPILAVTEYGLVVESEEDLEAISGEAARWAVVKDDVPPKEIFRLHRGSDVDRAKVAAYCIQDCDLTLELYKKLEVFNEAMSMANVCSVPVAYIFTRGQGIKIESLIFKDCMIANQLIEVLPGGDRVVAGEDSYEGAIVLDPIPGFYTDAPVGVCDFASLYPSTIISENISHDMLVWVKDYDMKGKLICMKYGTEQAEELAPAGTQFTDIEFDIWRPDPADTRKQPVKLRVGVRVCRYAQPPNDAKGSLPMIVGKLLAARKAKRNEMAKTDDPFKKALLDAEQNAYKVTANSLYGQLGSSTFKIRLQHLAASVTSYGRKQIMFAKAALEQFYGPEANDPRCEAKIVYGDTDSLFVTFSPRNPETGKLYEGREAIVKTIELTEEAGKFITSALKAPHDFEYDKVFYPFIIFSKKRYVGNKYEENPDEFKETSMGIVLTRRDNAALLKMCYGAAVNKLLNQRDVKAAVECVKDRVMELVEGKMKLSQLEITKSLRSEYATTAPAHKMLADRIKARDPGNAPASGDRIGYVFIKPPPGQKASDLQGDRVETASYIQEKGLHVDAEYYIEKQLVNPLSQLFGLMVERMPGFQQPREWSRDSEKVIAQREAIAATLLFSEGLQACRKSSSRAALKGMFGDISIETTGKGKRAPPKAMEAPACMAKKQGTLDSFFRDTAMINDTLLAKGMRTAKAKAKEAKEAKETKETKETKEKK